MKTDILALLFTVLISANLPAQSSPQREETANNTQSKSFVVPQGKGQQVVIDGKFSKGEWEDAVSFPVAAGFDLHVKADSQALYIGLKSAAPSAVIGCEIRYTENDKDVRLLHVSARLAEGLSGFPARGKFEIGNTGWESNLIVENQAKLTAWQAAGRPIEQYREVVEKGDGKEFRISRKILTGNRIKFTIGWMELAADGRKTFNYPEDASFQNADNWVELILPPPTK